MSRKKSKKKTEKTILYVKLVKPKRLTSSTIRKLGLEDVSRAYSKSDLRGLWWGTDDWVKTTASNLKKRGYKLKTIKVGIHMRDRLFIETAKAWVKDNKAYISLEKWEELL